MEVLSVGPAWFLENGPPVHGLVAELQGTRTAKLSQVVEELRTGDFDHVLAQAENLTDGQHRVNIEGLEDMEKAFAFMVFVSRDPIMTA
jgi:hypothetical protein